MEIVSDGTRVYSEDRSDRAIEEGMEGMEDWKVGGLEGWRIGGLEGWTEGEMVGGRSTATDEA